MAQSLQIGLYGPFTNLSFGIGKPSILDLKVNDDPCYFPTYGEPPSVSHVKP